MNKICSRCHETKSTSMFYADKRAIDRLNSHCKECHLSAQKEYRSKNANKFRVKDAKYRESLSQEEKRAREARYRQREDAKEKRAEYLIKWRKDNPEKHKAHLLVSRLIRSGKLVRPSSCEECGDSTVKIEASHDDYSKPEEVEWLCPKCHRIKDKSPLMTGVLAAKRRKYA